MSLSVVAVIPTFNKFVYARQTVLSFFRYSPPDAVVLVIDDASPCYYRQDWAAWSEGMPRGRLILRHFSENDGITRSWNLGLLMARDLRATYTVAGNSDILFTPGWFEPLAYHADRGLALVGPVTNAPGPTNQQLQNVNRYVTNYQVSDDPGHLAMVAARLRDTWPVETAVTCKLNGFCTMARTDRWWEGAFDRTHVFDPAMKMVGNEDELQRRWKARGWQAGFVPRSFVFHYRAVSRGDKYKHHGWCRLQAQESAL